MRSLDTSPLRHKHRTGRIPTGAERRLTSRVELLRMQQDKSQVIVWICVRNFRSAGKSNKVRFFKKKFNYGKWIVIYLILPLPLSSYSLFYCYKIV